jgi:hypothetical protein
MLLTVLRSDYDSTNGGVSSKANRLFVQLPNCPSDQSVAGDAPEMVLESHVPGCVRLVPKGEKRWVMFGGNFAHSSDSRLREAIERMTGQTWYGAIAIHDRIEVQS